MKTQYIRDLFSREDAALTDIITRTTALTETIQVNPEDARLLQMLIKLANVKTVVEIGTLAGYSALCMARALPADGHIYTIEADAGRAALARETFAKNTAEAAKITLLEGKAQDILPALSPKAPFDMIFIDADKPGYAGYLDWAEGNIKKSGLIVADNTFLFGAVYQEGLPQNVRPTTRDIMIEFNKRLSDPQKYLGILLPTVEGMTVAVKLF